MSTVPDLSSSVIAGYTPQEWAKMFLRGVGQIMFQDNALTGLLFLVGIAAGAFGRTRPLRCSWLWAG